MMALLPFFALQLATGLVFFAVWQWTESAIWSFAIAVSVQTLAAVALFYWQVNPFLRCWQSVQEGLRYFADGEFGIALPEQSTPLGRELRESFRTAEEQLQQQRLSSYQRELMLQTVVEQVSSALVLLDAQERILICNPTARALLSPTRSPIGAALAELLPNLPPNLAQALAQHKEARNWDCLITLESADLPETWQLSQQKLQLQGKPHKLLHLKPLTQAVTRAEVNAWKKLIRVFSHELNNSLGPMNSLSNSGRQLIQSAAPAERKVLEEIFNTLQNRIAHLTGFLTAYGQIARLPQPQLQQVDWARWLAEVKPLYTFHLLTPEPARPGFFDPAQLSQVLINLIKNAREAGAPESSIELSIKNLPHWDLLRLEDRGSGMSQPVLAQALLPFYSTKREGTGVGLALCREIIEAHSGRLSLQNRDGGGLRVDIWLPAIGAGNFLNTAE